MPKTLPSTPEARLSPPIEVVARAVRGRSLPAPEAAPEAPITPPVLPGLD